MFKKNLILLYILIISTLLIQCQCGDGPTEPSDTTRPTVISTLPLNNAINVPITDSVLIIFSEKLQTKSVTNITITISNKTPIVTLSDSTVNLTFTTPLDYSTSYTVTISTAITDLAGNSLLNQFKLSFTTEVDPATLPPTIISTYPSALTPLAEITDSITVTFSKDIDPTSINDTTFISADGRPGVVSYNSQTKTAIFKSTIPFAYDSAYTFHITTNVKDTNGNNLENLFNWNFTTPTIIPQVFIITPFFDSLIIGDTLTFTITATTPIGIDTVQYFIDSIPVPVFVDNYNLSSQYILDASSFVIGSEHSLYAVAFDSLGNFGYSDTITFFYLWQLVMTDGNEGFPPTERPNDLRKMFARSTNTAFEIRIEYFAPWDSAYFDTTVNLAVFLDTDFSSSTGRRTNGGDTINDIGAEYRALIGTFITGVADTVIHRWDPNCTDSVCWKGFQTFDSIHELNVPNFSKTLEFGLKWSDIGDPVGVDVVAINVIFVNVLNDPLAVIKDNMPDKTEGHVRIFKENRYIGPPPLISTDPNKRKNVMSTSTKPSSNNPFD